VKIGYIAKYCLGLLSPPVRNLEKNTPAALRVPSSYNIVPKLDPTKTRRAIPIAKTERYRTKIGVCPRTKDLYLANDRFNPAETLDAAFTSSRLVKISKDLS
jgi:hypothetical protein